MKVVLVLFKDDKPRRFPLSAAKTVIGRRPDCTLRIPSPDVSRRHCEVSVIEDEVTVRDLGSANGTYVNGRRIAEKTLKPGDELVVGPAHFYVQIDGVPADLQPRTAASGKATAAAAVGAAAVDEDVFRLDDEDLMAPPPMDSEPAGPAVTGDAGASARTSAKQEEEAFEIDEEELLAVVSAPGPDLKKPASAEPAAEEGEIPEIDQGALAALAEAGAPAKGAGIGDDDIFGMAGDQTESVAAAPGAPDSAAAAQAEEELPQIDEDELLAVVSAPGPDVKSPNVPVQTALEEDDIPEIDHGALAALAEAGAPSKGAAVGEDDDIFAIAEEELLSSAPTTSPPAGASAKPIVPAAPGAAGTRSRKHDEDEDERFVIDDAELDIDPFAELREMDEDDLDVKS